MPLSVSLPGLPRLPLPAAQLTVAGPQGEERVIALGWVGVVYTAPPLLLLQFGDGSGTAELPAAGESFVVALPDREGTMELAPGASPESADAAWPVRVDCRCRFLECRFGQYRLGGEVVAITRQGRRQELSASVVFSPLVPPFGGGPGAGEP